MRRLKTRLRMPQKERHHYDYDGQAIHSRSRPERPLLEVKSAQLTATVQYWALLRLKFFGDNGRALPQLCYPWALAGRLC
jgi:hypothetical protein